MDFNAHAALQRPTIVLRRFAGRCFLRTTTDGSRQDPTAKRSRLSRSTALPHTLVAGGLAYFALVGGTTAGEVAPAIQLVNAALLATVTIVAALHQPARADRIDRLAFWALTIFLLVACLALSPRAAFLPALSAVGYYAVHSHIRRLAADQRFKHMVALTLGTAGLAIGLVYAVVWTAVWAGWLAEGLPAGALFRLPIDPGPYGFKHNVALLAGLLIPFLFLLPRELLRPFKALALGVLGLILVLSGSRGLWLGAAVGLVPLIVWSQRGRLRAARSAKGVIAATLFVAAATFVLFGVVGGALVGRMANVLTLLARVDLWAASFREWLAHPLAGVGPGGWPRWLPTTSYFDTSAFSPRHPDSLAFQSLAELGLLGLAGVALGAAAAWLVIRHAPPATWWVAGFVAIACITANPTDLPFAVVLGVTWLAISAPRVNTESRSLGMPRRSLLAIGGSIVFALQGSLLVGAVFHDIARSQLVSGNLAGSVTSMQAAHASDPSNALYLRELGVLRTAIGDSSGAVADLRAAVAENPADDIAFSQLAIALHEAGETESAVAAAEEAVRLRGSDLVNREVLVVVARSAERTETARGALIQSLVLAPWLAATDSWTGFVGSETTADLLNAAAERAVRDPYAIAGGRVIWLAAMADRPDLVGQLPPGTQACPDCLAALPPLLRCNTDGAQHLSDETLAADAGYGEYWLLRAMIERSRGVDSDSTLRHAAQIGVRVDQEASIPVEATVSRSRADDQWVYRIVPLSLPHTGPGLPAVEQGLDSWITKPRTAARTGAPNSALGRCDA